MNNPTAKQLHQALIDICNARSLKLNAPAVAATFRTLACLPVQ